MQYGEEAARLPQLSSQQSTFVLTVTPPIMLLQMMTDSKDSQLRGKAHMQCWATSSKDNVVQCQKTHLCAHNEPAYHAVSNDDNLCLPSTQLQPCNMPKE